jgi:hypothetical protein
VRDGFFKDKLEWGVGAAGGGGKAAIAPAPTPTKICVYTLKPSKIGSVSETAWLFGPEDLVKTKFIIIYCKKNMDRTF